MINNSVKSPTVVIRNACLAYNRSVVFNALNLTLAPGKWSCLLGPSGVGKSTLLRMIANLNSTNSIWSGDIHSDNNTLPHQQVAYMAQTDLLLPWLNAFDNALLSASFSNSKNTTELAHELFIKTGLQQAKKKYPHELSGGMRQRVALIRTFLQNKPLVLMDEPFSQVDAITRFQLQSLAHELLINRTVFFVTHDPIEALRLADHIYILSGKPAKVHQPFHLKTIGPRDPLNPELIQYQAHLFKELLLAKEKTE